MKKITISILFAALFLSGCQQVSDQVNQTKSTAEKAYQDTANTVENTKKQIIETKQKVDEKVGQAQDAANAVSKLVE